ncbi:InlB B-repeat-containing protein, partial [Candidatus Saccharibacteria bacterium]|nr:InlB B-repeat-containing protein [Candidatus Saccharibacteria bacterium]
TTSNSFNFYYGVNVSTAKTPGTYGGEVLYTVLMNDACLKYTLNFNGNSATTNTLTSQDLTFDSTIDLSTISSSSVIARTGYTLTGWKDQNNNEYGTSGTADINPSDLASVTLTAQWTANSYAVVYNANGGTGTTASQTGQTYGSNVTLRANGFTYASHTFLGWSLDSTAEDKSYDASTTYTVAELAAAAGVTNTNGATITLYAIWEEESGYALTLKKGNTTAIASVALTNTSTGATITSGSAVAEGTSVTATCTPKSGYHCTEFTSSDTTLLPSQTGNTAVGTYTYSFTMPAGAITLTAKGSGNTFTINYNSNGGSGTTTATTATYGSNVTLATDNFTAPSGKIFKAWGTDSSGTTTYEARTAVAPATLYPSVTTTQGGSITLYAIWETITNDGSKGNFQTANICSSIGVGHTATLKDTRDNQTYTVYRFRNTGTAAKSYPTSMAGYCIMTKDLSLGYVSGGSITKGGNLSLTTSTSNFDTSGSNSSYETITLSGTQTVTYRTDKSVWDTTNSYTNMQYTNGPSSAGNTYSTHSYYSYGAALVVCPKGWRLPTNTENGYIRTFMGGGNANGSAKIRSAPYNFVYGGFFVSSGWYDVGSSGLYWASTQGSSTNGYGLDFYSSSLGTYVDLKFRGRSVRCVSAP